MNYNIYSNQKFPQFLSFTNGNKLTEGQMWLLIISTALKQSLTIYQSQWKSQHLSSNGTDLSDKSNSQSLKINLPDEEEAQKKLLKPDQQNKKSIFKISYNQKFSKNDQIQQIFQRKQLISNDKNFQDEQKQIKTASQYVLPKKHKIIHRNQCPLGQSMRKPALPIEVSLLDLYEPAYIPKTQFSYKEIREKREKLLMRKVLSWKQIDKKVGFRKMELKKLLS